MRNKLLYSFIAVLIAAFLGYLPSVAFADEGQEGQNCVDNLNLMQTGSDVVANWSSMDCDSYEVIVFRDGRLTMMLKTKENQYTISGVHPGERCVVTVRAHLKDGSTSDTAKTELTAEKIRQNIMVEDTIFYGFAGNTFNLNASANGDMQYSSADQNIARVDDRGNITLKKSGDTDIIITAEGNGLFTDARRTVELFVYPTVLAKVKGTATEDLSPSRAIIRWGENEYAAAYKILRKNPATQEYLEIAETPAETRYLEVTRDDYDYVIKGIAEVNGEKVDGKISDPVPVRGTTEEAPAYSKFKVIGKLGKNELNLVAEIHGAENAKIPQGISIVGDKYVVSYVNWKSTAGYLIEYSKADGSKGKTKDATGIRHGNGCAYNPNTNRLYVLSTIKGKDSKKCFVFDAETKKLVEKIDMPKAVTSIAYDVSNDKFYLAKGKNMYVCDSSFKVEKAMTKTVKLRSTQDIGAYNGTILACTWPGENKSYIDIYRVSDGAYLGSYDVSIGEIESCVVDDGYLVILMNTIGSADDRIYKTKERIAIP
ncbi:MAG: hypothetical protein IJH05_06470 [Firmicutes bacterium]|nr:hypothetical protein [Bacillota bacterium]